MCFHFYFMPSKQLHHLIYDVTIVIHHTGIRLSFVRIGQLLLNIERILP